MTRRQLLTTAGSAALFSPLMQGEGEAIPNPRGHLGMGGAPAGFGAWNAAHGGAAGGRGRGAGRPFMENFFDYCHSLGLGVAEAGSPPTKPEDVHRLRDKMSTYDMWVIFDVGVPRDESDVERFEAGVKAAKEAGGYGLHAALTQRRYEQFSTLADYQASFARNQKSVALAEPILRKYKMRLALENHKGWSAVEQAAWLKRLGSEWVGVHFDFGNNVSFLEDPMFTLETLKPWIFSCHIKDMSVQPYDEGFLLSEVVLGDGFLDLKKMVDTLRAKDPNIPMDLECITREPLKIPVYTDKYWVTFNDMPPRQVAHMMEIIQKNPPKKPVPHIAGLDPAARLKAEEEDNIACIKYARAHLGL
ncbi:MAG: sugar phosphate isomerase/epimerase [Acidobacteriota bacterium]|nr:sugar phosphate isomerase/epimerase [Acidobacteriota bacterium]